MTDTRLRVRFAPSPTGWLHIGGARTALYNWLYARKTGGVFVLRIEDTDAERSTEESYRAIIDALEWLGLDWDEGPEKGGPLGPYVQSARQVLYHTEVRKLIDRGLAYYCFCTQDELAEIRSEAMQQRESPRYDGRCRNLPRDEVERRLARRVPHVVRVRMPEGETQVFDMIRGAITFDNNELDDFVLIKSDDKPTYNFAAVVDDARMEITHVIRGDDHLSNTPKQIVIYQALGYKIPKFAHLPMILGSDRTRLSKRHGAASVQEFRRMGYLSESLVNYLALLGWAYDDKTEFFTRDSLIKKFSLKKVSKNPAAFDPDKLDHIDGEHFKCLDPMKRVEIVYERLVEEDVLPADFRPAEWAGAEAAADVVPEAGSSGNGDEKAYRAEVPRLAIILKEMGNRLKNVKDVASKLAYFYKDTYPVDDTAVAAHLAAPESAERLAAMANRFEALVPWDRGTIEDAARLLAEALEIKAGDLIHPCRVALTGQTVSPDIFTVVHLLGRDKTVERLRAAASRVGGAIGG
jgi:glutamyl-tRNA synthetase